MTISVTDLKGRRKEILTAPTVTIKSTTKPTKVMLSFQGMLLSKSLKNQIYV